MNPLINKHRIICGVFCLVSFVVASSAVAQPQLAAPYAGRFTLESISGDVGDLLAQMTFGDDDDKLYLATYTGGVYRFDYSAAGQLTNQRRIWVNPNTSPPGGVRGVLGIAVHRDPVLNIDVIYLSQAEQFLPGNTSSLNSRIQSVIRITDSNNDGTWGGAGDVNQAVLNNIQVTTHHQINNLQVRGNSLFMGVGVQTNPGNNESAYNGTISWIEDLTQLSGDTTTPNLAGFDTPAGNGLGADGHHVDPRPLTSTDPSKLRVYSTGIRNPFGIAIQGADRNGDVWATENQTGPDTQQGNQQDRFLRSEQFLDHGFEKFYQTDGDLQNAPSASSGTGTLAQRTSGQQNNGVDIEMDPLRDNLTNWKDDAAAQAAGFFQPGNVDVGFDVGFNVSANGFDFYYGGVSELNGRAVITQFSKGKLVMVDPVTGDLATLITGVAQPLSVVRAPDGGILFGANTGVYRIADVVPEPAGLALLALGGLMVLRRRRIT